MKKMEKTKNELTRETIVSTHELAEVLGLSSRHINRLEKENILQKIGYGKYKLCASTQTYINYRVGQAERDEDDVSFSEEKALLTKAQREKAEIEVAELKEEVYRAEIIIPIIQELLLGVRNRLLAIPARCAPQVIAASELIDVQEIIKREIYDALSELSTWGPESLSRKRGKKNDKPAETT